jgi:hypothetical protein
MPNYSPLSEAKGYTIAVVKKKTLIRYSTGQGRPATAPLTRKRITFLSPVRLEEMTWIGLVIYGEVGQILADTGATIQYTSKPWIHRSRIHHPFDDLIDESKSNTWILYSSSFKAQEYFQKNAIPAVLFRNAYKGIELPTLTIDYSAALRHCPASLRRLNHDPKNILLVLPDTKLAGNLQLKETFSEILGPAASRQIILYEESTDNTRQAI